MSGPTLTTGEPATEAAQEADLVARVIAGDRLAFTQLYDLYQDRVFRHVHYRVSQREDAKDLTQQVFLQSWRGLPKYRRTASPFLAWLFTIAHNVIVDFYRRSKPVYYLEHEFREKRTGSDPEHEAEVRWEQERVRKAVLRLKPDQQQVIVLRFLENLDAGDVAAVLGKTESNVRVIQHRAVQELRRILEREGR